VSPHFTQQIFNMDVQQTVATSPFSVEMETKMQVNSVTKEEGTQILQMRIAALTVHSLHVEMGS